MMFLILVNKKMFIFFKRIKAEIQDTFENEV